MNPHPVSDETAYDTVRYPSYTHPQTHPDRLATAARLYGLNSKPITRCRVLELGCGDGANLLPMAHGLPESEFVGIDLAAQRIAEGEDAIRSLGLQNVRLVAGDLSAITTDWGSFDYIVAHGLYSWVPEAVRDRLLAVCHENLANDGVAFVSYNAFPGGHIVRMLREMLLFHVRAIESPEDRVTQARSLLQLLAGALPSKDSYHQWIRSEAERVFAQDRGHLFHDQLAEINDPIYFTNFMAHAARHGLQYLAEADFFELADYLFPPAAREALRPLESNRILREQYMDFIKCRRFRQTLLCRSERSLPQMPDAQRLADMFIAAVEPYKLEGLDLLTNEISTITTANGGRIQTDFAPGKAALLALGEACPDLLSLPELVERVVARMVTAGLPQPDSATLPHQLCPFLLELIRAGMVTAHVWRPTFSTTISERPQASSLARWQARHQGMATSVFHTAVQFEDEAGRHLIQLLDGTRDRATLAGQMYAFLQSKSALDEKSFTAPELHQRVDEDLIKNLQKLARVGLLTG